MNAPYKLCDYKSFYGYLFEEYIEEYDFWGYCDCDVIFGQLNHFLTDDLFEKYDKILRTGHLSFIRNHKNINENFLHYDTYKMVLSSSVIYGYDESIGGYHLGFAGELLEQGYQFYGNDELAADVDFRYYPFFVVTEPENPCVFSYENGAVYRIDRKENSYIKREVMYLHLQKRKMAVNEGILPERYIICPNEFKSYSEKELLSDEFWIRNTTDQENYFDFRVECFRNIKRDFQRLLHEPQKIECIRYRLKGQKES